MSVLSRCAYSRGCLSACALLMVASPAFAQTGTLTGRVTNALTGAPVTTAQVTVIGTQISGAVDADGRFSFANVPVSAREVLAHGPGYTPITATFSLAANGTAMIALAMAISPFELDAIVVTGSVGDARRRAVGHPVTVVNASEIMDRSVVTNLAGLLQARVPGLTLFTPSGTVGTAVSYRLRGASSLAATNHPAIYLDGVRVTTRSQGNYPVFGQETTALDAIDPADIESIEVIKGPSAATLYGAEAAAGVIQIFTKKGRPGRMRWDMRVETGAADWDESLRPVNYAIATAQRIADPMTWPGFVGTSVGDVISFRPLSDGRALRTGNLVKLALSASGGGAQYSFFVAAARSNEEGVFFNNFSNRSSLRGNFTFVPTNQLTFSTYVALSQNHVRLPLNDNAGPPSLITSSYLAVPGRAYDFPGGLGYQTLAPETSNRYDNQTWADRYTIGAIVDYQPVAWLRNRFQVGLDANVGRAQLYFAPDPRKPPAFVARHSLDLDNFEGFIAQGRPLNRELTLNYSGTVTHQLSEKLVSNTSFGMQYLANQFRRTDAIGQDLGNGAVRSVASAAVTSSTESWSEQKSVGFYAQQQLSLDDRLFVTLATRVDNNSAFGAKLRRVFYPKAAISYVISEESFFDVPAISSLRLRAAWGQAGNAPGPYDAVRAYNTSVVTYPERSTSALRYASLGNPDLRPERGSEIDVGFESAFFDGRVGLDFSYYHKTTRDALIPVPIPASTGFTGDQLTNLGEISNTGVELLLTAIPLQRKSLTIDATLALATNRNRLVSFGDERAPMFIGLNVASVQRYQEGFPLGGFWANRVQYNHDGTLLKDAAGRPVLDTASIYMGPSAPTRELALSGGILLFRRLRLHGLLDYKAGHYQFNATERRRDEFGITWETANPAANPDEVLVRRFAAQTFVHVQSADFVKLRDVSITYDVPSQLLLGVARKATFMVAGHNLKMWTKYDGADPEVNYSGANRFNRDDLWTVPQIRRYAAALTFTF